MRIFEYAAGLQEYLRDQKSAGRTIGFVPTMGALHAGHLSLVRTARSKTDITVVSLFVNPTQFNNPEDFRRYPVQPEKDRDLLADTGCDVLFMPSKEEIYPDGSASLPSYPLGYLDTIMEGKFRPGHFQGVCQVVERLLEIVEPHILFLGRKDLQQCKVIERLLTLTGKKEQIQLEICATIREEDGLAMSSRNARLSPADRKKAALLYKGMTEIKDSITKSSFSDAKRKVMEALKSHDILLEYMELVDSDTMAILQDWESGRALSICVAAYVSDTRLIDNIQIEPVH